MACIKSPLFAGSWNWGWLMFCLVHDGSNFITAVFQGMVLQSVLLTLKYVWLCSDHKDIVCKGTQVVLCDCSVLAPVSSFLHLIFSQFLLAFKVVSSLLGYSFIHLHIFLEHSQIDFATGSYVFLPKELLQWLMSLSLAWLRMLPDSFHLITI